MSLTESQSIMLQTQNLFLISWITKNTHNGFMNEKHLVKHQNKHLRKESAALTATEGGMRWDSLFRGNAPLSFSCGEMQLQAGALVKIRWELMRSRM